LNLLFNLSDLKELLINYYVLTKMRVAIFDNNFCEIASYPTRLSTYCYIIRTDPNANQKCVLCDYEAFKKCQETGSLYIYQCHAGLTEAIVPIKADEMIIGYIMMGQVLNTASKIELWNEVIKQMRTYKLDLHALKQVFDRKENVSTKIIKSSAKMMEICASYLYSNQKMVIQKDTLAQQIDEFIGMNIQENLSVPKICKHFNIGKTKLHETSIENFGTSIAKHIHHIRIQRAKEYLLDTSLAIYEIADRVGVYDYNYFTKIFKKETGVTPKAFRKENLPS